MREITVLYIEDDDSQRRALADALGARGYTVHAAASGEEGIEVFRSVEVDAVLCDLNMPSMSGIAVLTRLRNLRPDVPVLILTAHGTVPEAVEAIRRGASDFIRKPTQIDEIEVSLRNAVERRSLVDEVSRLEESVESAVKERTERLETAYQRLVSSRFARVRDENEFWHEVPVLLCEALRFDRASLMLEEDGRLRVKSFHFASDAARYAGAFGGYVASGAPPPRIMQEAFEKNETVFVGDARSDPRTADEAHYVGGVCTIVASPVRLREEAIGVIAGSLHHGGHEMDRNDVARFEMFAVMVGLALENIRAYQGMEEKVRRRTQELEDNAVALARANVDLLGVQEELEETNRALKSAEERMMSILEASPLPLIVTRHADGKIIYANDHIADIVGMRARDLIGRQTPDFYHDPSERAKILAVLERDGRIVDREVQMKRADGTVAWMLFSFVSTELSGERVIIGGLYDIDERKRAEAALQESEELFRGIVESANDIIFTLGTDLTISYVSPNVTKLLGYAPAGMTGSDTANFIHADDAVRSAEAFRRVLESGETLTNHEHRVLHRDGSVRWYSLNASLVRDAEGAPQFLVGITHDFTERKRSLEDLERAHEELRAAQSQLVQSEKMASLGMLVAGIAHEINTPVGAIGSMHDTLSRSVEKLRAGVADLCAGDPAVERRFEPLFCVIQDADRVIKSGVDRVTTIVRRLRSFARLDEAELKEADVNEGIEDTLTLIHHEIKHNITVVKNFGVLPKISCFPGRLNQVFLNLLVNARQAISGKGTITIETFASDHHVVVRISDTGVGIPAANLRRIFDPGFTTKGVGVGTGLGLSICYRIVEDHHGDIGVESTPGVGTTFTVRIPDNLDEVRGNGEGSGPVGA
jgi:PAS domain S-box-containing protein